MGLLLIILIAVAVTAYAMIKMNMLGGVVVINLPNNPINIVRINKTLLHARKGIISEELQKGNKK